MLSNFISAIAIAVVLIAALDQALSAAAKERLELATVRVWSLLDGLKSLSFLYWIRKFRGLFLVGLPIFALLLTVEYKGEIPQPLVNLIGIKAYVLVLAPFVLASAFGSLFIWLALRPKSPKGILFNAIILATIAYFVLRMHWGVYWLYYIAPYLPGFDWLAYPEGGDIFVSVFVHMLIIFSACVILPVLFALFAQGVLLILEFLVRRIAEYKKGPLYAVGAILGSIAIVLKEFSN
jgi:hypothetical protein